MENLKLVHQLFIGKVADEIGVKKTTQLLKEAKEAFAIPDVVGQSERLKCQCKKAKFTRTVDADFNPLCGRCGKAL